MQTRYEIEWHPMNEIKAYAAKHDLGEELVEAALQCECVEYFATLKQATKRAKQIMSSIELFWTSILIRKQFSEVNQDEDGCFTTWQYYDDEAIEVEPVAKTQ